jgi:hypothetical protein
VSVIYSDQIHKIEKGDEDLKVRFLGIAELIAQGEPFCSSRGTLLIRGVVKTVAAQILDRLLVTDKTLTLFGYPKSS